MVHLIVVSLIWAFSFGLTKGKLAGLDSAFISAARLGLASLVFLPFLRWPGARAALKWLLIGAIQFGAMYLALNESYRYLPSHLVALFTLTTPLLVVAFDPDSHKGSNAKPWLGAGLSLVAGFLVTHRGALGIAWETLIGLGLVQLANGCFAFGQVAYRRFGGPSGTKAASVPFAWMYLGAFLAVVPVWLARGHGLPALTLTQFTTLVYLGCLASGVCFFLWNVGATRVSTGTLAVMNNAKVPLAVACSLFFFNETADAVSLIGAFALLALAVWVVRK